MNPDQDKSPVELCLVVVPLYLENQVTEYPTKGPETRTLLTEVERVEICR